VLTDQQTLAINWNQLTLLMISFLASGLGGWVGWMNRPKPRSLIGSALAGLNCGTVGILASGGCLLQYPDAYLQAFLLGLLTGWTTGRYGIRKLPEVAGLLIRALSVFQRGEPPTGKSDSE
jgi:hypothetical protein